MVYRQLAQISRSTRGVILLLGNLQATRRIMTEAHRSNMVGGHFIWLWIDTSTSTGYFHQASAPFKQPLKPHQPIQSKGNNVNGTQPNEKQKTDFVTSTYNYDKSEQNVNIPKKPQLTTDVGKELINKTTSSKNKERFDSNHKQEDQSPKTSGDFSQGFDPFRVLQRQDEHLKPSFGSSQHYQDRNASRDNKQTPNNNRLILGLRNEETTATTEIDDQNARGKKTQRSYSQEDISEALYNERNGSGHTNKNMNNNFFIEDDENPIFILNQTNTEKNSNLTKYRNFSDDNLDDFIDNNNFNENNNLMLNLKRTSTANVSNSSSFVNFHQFKEFPVGLLALRPIRMNVNRHFIRAAVRFFAATWEKINGSKSIVNTTPLQQGATSPSNRRTQQNRQQGTTTLYNAKKIGNEMHSRKMRRKRNINTVNQLLTVMMNKRAIKTLVNSEIEREYEHENDGKQMERQAVSATMPVNNSLFLNEFNSNSDKGTNNGNGTKSQHLNEKKDIAEHLIKFDSSFTSDLPNDKTENNTYYFNISGSLTNVNISFNRNFSGLWKQNSINKSNNKSINSMRHHETITKVAAAGSGHGPLPLSMSNVTIQPISSLKYNDTSAESMAKQASKSVVEIFFGTQTTDIRQPLIKRQNAWWSTKKEQSPLITQQNRPQYDASNKNFNQLSNVYHIKDMNQMKWETPSYAGGCYGASTQNDVKNAEYFSR